MRGGEKTSPSSLLLPAPALLRVELRACRRHRLLLLLPQCRGLRLPPPLLLWQRHHPRRLPPRLLSPQLLLRRLRHTPRHLGLRPAFRLLRNPPLDALALACDLLGRFSSLLCRTGCPLLLRAAPRYVQCVWQPTHKCHRQTKANRGDAIQQRREMVSQATRNKPLTWSGTGKKLEQQQQQQQQQH
jgi:hypothetical protein